MAEADGWELAQEIREMEQRLGPLSEDLKSAMILKTEARVKLVEADAAVGSCKAEIDIVKTRIMAKQSLLRALPK